MHSIQIFIPLYNQEYELFPKSYFNQLRSELTDKFGGITAYIRSPASGFWKENEYKTIKDDIIIFEVMTEKVDKEWWYSMRKRLEGLFKQDQIIVRTWEIDLL